MNRVFSTLAAFALATPVFADGHATGDPAEGEAVFKKCKTCHMIVSDSGEEIYKGGKTGPNLWGVYQRVPGSVEGFRYGADLVKAGESFPDGWDQETFAAYVADPRQWLRDTLDDKKAKSKMSFKLKDEVDQANVWAYLVSVGPAPEPAAEQEETESTESN